MTFYQRQLQAAREAAKNPNRKITAFVEKKPTSDDDEEQTNTIKKATEKAATIANSNNENDILNTFKAGQGNRGIQNSEFKIQNYDVPTATTTQQTNPQNQLVESLFKEYQPKLEIYEPNNSNPFEYRSLF